MAESATKDGDSFPTENKTIEADNDKHENEITEKQLAEILAQPAHSVPFKCDLYFLLHDIITQVHRIHPPIYGTKVSNGIKCRESKLVTKPRSYWDQDSDDENESSNSKLNDAKYPFAILILEMCEWVYSDNMEYEMNNFKNNLKLIQCGLSKVDYIDKLNVVPPIIAIIASYTLDVVTPFKFNRKLCQSKRYKNQITINDKFDKLWFDHDREDFLLLLNESKIEMDTCIMRFDTFVLGKGDEMWIGVINESEHKNILQHGGYSNGKWKNAIVYYGQRESHIRRNTLDYGNIINNGEKYGKNVPFYRAYDWISIIVDNIKKEIIFLKNNSVVSRVAHLPSNGENLYYVCEVDTGVDGFFVQQYPLLLTNVD